MRLSRTILGAVVVLCASFSFDSARAQDTNMKRAHAATLSAQAYKRQGDLKNAENMFRIAMESSPDSSIVHQEAADQIEYYIPLMRVQRLLWEGNMRAAEEELLRLQLQFDGQPFRRQEINRILHGLLTSTIDSGSPDESNVDERLMMRNVKLVMDDYYSKNQRYPTSRDQLKEVLAFDRPPLSLFDVRQYGTDGLGYLLILHSKRDPNHLLTLHNTGLVR